MALTLQDARELAVQNSPYLTQLLVENPDIATGALTDVTGELERIQTSIQGENTSDTQELMELLRGVKRRAHLLIALMDIARLWDCTQVTRHLTQLADSALQTALSFALKEAGFEGDGAGIFVIAVGKYGAFELNYSSDIDFMVFYDPDVVTLPQTRKPQLVLIRLVQKMVKLLDQITHSGYVFRCDLRLRPDPRSNAVMVSTSSAERYYESLGQNWERAAMIKARVCAGDQACGQAFIDETLKHFIWRRSLDFAAIADIQAMKRQINSAGGHTDIQAAGHNLKLGRGGIREIEFYTQTQQLILGGRRPALRKIRTDAALMELQIAGFIKESQAHQLIADYEFLRSLEHRAQMIDDAQTHLCPVDPGERLKLAKLANYDALSVFDAHVQACLTRVNMAYMSLYPDAPSLASDQGSLSFTGVSPDPETLEVLVSFGFTRASEVWVLMSGWLGGRIAATRTARARESLTRLAPSLLLTCSQSGMPDDAFFRFAEFFEGLSGGVSVLALFERQPKLMKDCLDLMAQAPRLAGVLSSQPEIIDALIDPDFETPLQDADGGLGRHSTDEQDLEEAMNAVRRRVREQHFQYGAGVLRGALSHDKASSLITRLADESVQTLLQAAIKDVERRLERPGGQAAVLAMGKMGGHEMTIGSDLDIMVIYDSRGHDQQAAHVFYTKVTQRLISALSAPTQEGGLYEVDMALRPSGSAGPITVSFAAFERYYASEAWVWEFMALTRGRVCASTDEAFQNRLTASVEAILPCAGSTAKIKADVLNMRLRLERDKPPRGLWDVKRCRGGLVDIEFIVQYLQLVHAKTTLAVLGQNTHSALENLRDNDGLEARLANPLMSAHALYSKMRHYLAVSIGGKFLPDDHPNIISDNLSTYCGFDTFSELTRVYENTKDESLAIFKALLG